jgi:hypothetical protein
MWPEAREQRLESVGPRDLTWQSSCQGMRCSGRTDASQELLGRQGKARHRLETGCG